MSKIAWIVLVMTLALVGLLVVQAVSVGTLVQLNRELFENNVQTALKHIVAQIEQVEIDETAQLFNLPRPTDLGQDLVTRVEVEEISSFIHRSSADSLPFSKVESPQDEDYKISNRSLFSSQAKQAWKRGDPETFMSYFTTYFTHYSVVQDIPLERRLSFKHMDSIIQAEFKLADLGQPYVYGLYSNRAEALVLSNLQSDFPQQAEFYQEDLTRFRYQIQLFPSAKDLIGVLYLDFPLYSRWTVWSGMVGRLLSTAVFMLIIIFCFYYTVGVLISQRKLSAMKNDFINNMTHELKTPIATISIASDTVQNLLKSEKIDKIPRFINIIKEENRRLHGQVEKVLQTALIEKKEFKLNLTNLHVHEILLDAAEKIGLQVERKGGEVLLELEAEQDVVEADETHFTNVVHNLLDNANKYSLEAPKITLRTYNRPKGLVIEVADKGMGISKEAKKHIFEKFYRVTTGNRHDVKGFGLGLSYVKSMVQAHSAEIEVQSELGKGTTFVLFFPFKQPSSKS